MKVAIPREIKNNEFRVAITPAGVHDLVGARPRGVRRDRRRSRLVDPRRGSTRGRSRRSSPMPRAPGRSPISCSRSRSRSRASTGTSATDLVLFTYLHLAAEPELTARSLASGVTAIAYETVQLPEPRAPPARPDERGGRATRPHRRREHDAEAERRTRPAGARRPGNAPGRGHRARRRRRRHERDCRSRSASAPRSRCSTPTSPGCASSTPSTPAASGPSPRTASRSTRPSSTPTW